MDAPKGKDVTKAMKFETILNTKITNKVNDVHCGIEEFIVSVNKRLRLHVVIQSE
jgi:hypothetical protein